MARFATMEDVARWIRIKSKEYGGKNRFLASDEYKEAYPEIKRLHQQVSKTEKTDLQRQAHEAMRETGVDYGDRAVGFDGCGL